MMRFFRAVFFGVISFTFSTLIAPDVGAQTCGNSVCTESEICLAGDGVIVDGGGVGGCVRYFMGSTISFPVSADLDNYGGFPAETEVHIEGCAVSAFGLCPISWSIRDNTIQETNPPAVPALGRSGQVLAVLFMLGIGSFGIWRSRQLALHRLVR